MVEFALVLPILLLFLIGMAEVGYAMYNYITLAGANREGARLASRGRFSDQAVAARVVSAGGSHEITPGVVEPYLKTTGAGPNTGIIVTRIVIPIESGDPIQTNVSVSGTLTIHTGAGPETRFITTDDSKLADMSSEDLLSYLDYRRDVSDEIYKYRVAGDYEANAVETFVIVETFFAHETLTHFIPFMQDPSTLYFDSTLRIMQDSRLD